MLVIGRDTTPRKSLRKGRLPSSLLYVPGWEEQWCQLEALRGLLSAVAQGRRTSRLLSLGTVQRTFPSDVVLPRELTALTSCCLCSASSEILSTLSNRK